jgi:hypothetical protein
MYGKMMMISCQQHQFATRHFFYFLLYLGMYVGILSINVHMYVCMFVLAMLKLFMFSPMLKASFMIHVDIALCMSSAI